MHSSTRLRGGALIGVLAVAGGLVLPTSAFAAEDPVVKDDPIRLETGHVDAFNLVLNADDSVRLLLKEDVTGSHILRTPESVELGVLSEAYTTGFPSAFAPPGMPTSFYNLPLTQDPKLVWPGWDTQGVQSAYPGAKTEIDLQVQGPGDVYLWTQGSFGDPKSLLVGGGYELPAAINAPIPAHTHTNWGFTEPGTYTLTAQARVASADGTKTSTSNSATYTFEVDPAPTSVTISGADEQFAAGDDVTLTAAQAPAGANFATYAWESRDSASADWAVVSGATSATLTVPAKDGQEFRATVSGGKNVASGEAQPISVQSAPVTIQVEDAPAAPTVSIAALADHYHSNSPIDLTAEVDPEVDGATYRWYLQRTDQDERMLIDGATGPTHRLTAEQALNGAQATVEVIGADDTVLATSKPATIEVDDHGAAPLQKVSITGLADHYHSGDEASLTASVAPASVLTKYQWFVQKKGETAPSKIDGATSATYSFPVTAEYADAAFLAALTYDDGRTYVQSAPVLVRLDDHGAIPETELSIATNRDAEDYWVGQTATLTATQSTPTGLSTYEWLAKLPGASDFAVVSGQQAAEYKFKPTLANSGVQVKVRLLHDGETHAESDAVTITTQQRPVATELLVNADKDEYAPGDVAQLRSTQSPETGEAHYHWYIKKAGASDYVWVDQSREKDLDYPVTAEDAGAQLVVRLFDEAHATIAESAPFTVVVGGGAVDPEPVTTLTVQGLASGYYVGDTAELSAVQTPATGEDHYHWFIKRSGDADYSVISGAYGAELSHVVATGDADASIVAKLYDHDHAVIAESTPVALTVLPGSAKPADAPAAQNGSALDGVDEGGITASDETPAAGQVITIQVGAERAGEWVAAWLFSEPVLLNGDWTQVAADGTVAVTIPADTPAGAHRLAVFAADGTLIGWQAIEVSAAAAGDPAAGGAAVAPADALATTGGEIASGILVAAIVLLLAGSSAFVVSRRMARRNAAE